MGGVGGEHREPFHWHERVPGRVPDACLGEAGAPAVLAATVIAPLQGGAHILGFHLAPPGAGLDAPRLGHPDVDGHDRAEPDEAAMRGPRCVHQAQLRIGCPAPISHDTVSR